MEPQIHDLAQESTTGPYQSQNNVVHPVSPHVINILPCTPMSSKQSLSFTVSFLSQTYNLKFERINFVRKSLHPRIF